jgi:outer membrane protein TolC
MALRASPRVQQARQEREAARLAAAREKPGFGSGLSIGAAASGMIQGPRITFPARDEEATVVPRRRLRLELTAEQVLFRPGARFAGTRATAAEEVADLELRRAEEEVALAVARAFLRALSARAGAEAAARGALAAQEGRRRVEQLLAAGRATPGERLQAEAEEAEAERAARAARRAVELADATLNRALGRPIEATLELSPAPEPAEEIPSQDAAVAEALRQRADLAILRRQAASAAAGAALAELARRPTVTAAVGYALQTPSAFIARSSWSAAVSVEFPLWDGNRARLEAAEARARAASARSGLTELESAVGLEVLQARLAVMDAADRVETTRRAAVAATELLRATELRLGRGRATALELVAARATLRRAEADAARARYDLQIAWAVLRHALGRMP